MMTDKHSELMLKAEYWKGFLDGKLAGMEEYERLQSPGYAMGVLMKLGSPSERDSNG